VMDRCIECRLPVRADEGCLTYDGHTACSTSCKRKYHDDSGISHQLQARAKGVGS
jgi:hypothetical protein